MSEVAKRSRGTAVAMNKLNVFMPEPNTSIHNPQCKDNRSVFPSDNLPFSPTTKHALPKATTKKKAPKLSLDSESLSLGIRESLTPNSSYSASCAYAYSVSAQGTSTPVTPSAFPSTPPVIPSFTPALTPSLTHSQSSGRSKSMEKWLLQKKRKNSAKKPSIRFRKWAMTESNGKVIMLSKGLQSGYHEFAIKILKCDVEKQEIGLISVGDIDDVSIRDDGVSGTNFGARSVYGNEMETDSVFYGSWNDNGTRRCFRDLSSLEPNRNWCTGDVIRVCVDLDKYRIKYVLNGVRVKKVMSLQKKKKYYPFICFSGNCQYKLL